MKKIKKLMALTLIGTSMLVAAPIASHAEWRADTTGWWYTEGSSSTSRLFESLYGHSLTITLEEGEYVQLTGAQIIA